MIRLGHIEYSNCLPVHALLLMDAASRGIELVSGTPAELNRALADGSIDVAPCSSIEYARHSESYRMLPDFVIGSDGPVGSIILETKRPLQDLAGCTVAVPTASATSVALLKILLQLKYSVQATFQWFDQEHALDPMAEAAEAALWIGDVALRRAIAPGRQVIDLGVEWKDWTGLPFVFATWQTSVPARRSTELHALLAQLHTSRNYFLENSAHLAEAYAPQFGIGAARLLSYWQSLRYDFDAPMQQGLLKYFELAAQLGEAPAVTRLNWI